MLRMMEIVNYLKHLVNLEDMKLHQIHRLRLEYHFEVFDHLL